MRHGNQKHDWDAMEPEIFEMLKAGRGLKHISVKLGVPRNTLEWWWLRPDVAKRYEEFCGGNPVYPRKRKTYAENDKKICRPPIDNGFRERCKAFREMLLLFAKMSCLQFLTNFPADAL